MNWVRGTRVYVNKHIGVVQIKILFVCVNYSLKNVSIKVAVSSQLSKKAHLFRVCHLFYFLIFSEILFLLLLQPSQEGNGSVCVSGFFFLTPQKRLKGKSWKCLDCVFPPHVHTFSRCWVPFSFAFLWLLNRTSCFVRSSHTQIPRAQIPLTALCGHRSAGLSARLAHGTVARVNVSVTDRVNVSRKQVALSFRRKVSEKEL
jgi:hypothetical protein